MRDGAIEGPPSSCASESRTVRSRLAAGSLAALAALLLGPAPAVAVLSGSGTATLDGVLAPGEWDGAGSAMFPLNLIGGGTTPATLRVMNDATDLYLALSFSAEALSYDADFELDANGDGLFGGAQTADDGIGLSSNGGTRDNFRLGLTAPLDTEDGGTNDVLGAYAKQNSDVVLELSHPLDSGDVGHDMAFGPSDVFAFRLSARLIESPDVVDSFYPSQSTVDQIEIAPEPEAALCGALASLALALLARRARR